jgi:hypothetical protein
MAKTNYSPTFPTFPGDAAPITCSDTVNLPQPSVVYTASGGNIKVTTAEGTDVTFNSVNAGSILPVRVIRVWSSGTATTTGLVAIF